jgi:hypothetical protein
VEIIMATNFGDFGLRGLAVRGLPILNTYSGKVFWVDSNTTRGGSKGTFDMPCTTIAGALALCTANRGDLIVCKEFHAETVSAAAGIALSVAGVTVLGLGVGKKRPTITLGTITSASVTVTAANVTVQNLRLVSAFADVATAFDVTAAGFSAIGCDFGDSAVDLNLVSAIKCTSIVDGNANDFTAIGNTFLSQDAATLGFVIFAADVLKARIEDNIIVSEGTGLATIFTCATGKDIRMCSVQRNRLSNKSTAGNLAYSNDTASPNNSGVISDNYIGHADVTGQMTAGVVGGCRMFNNLLVSTDALSGFVIPAIDVDL